MEMNTRLQVEQPVTEAVTGLDLVEWQLRIARGEPLPAIQREVGASGHAIEVRLCAEDEAFTPHNGVIRRFIAPDGVRFDHALQEGMTVTPHYDSMLGKLIAHAPTREQAIDRLAGALERLVVLGLPTNRGLLIECLRDPRFRRGEAGIAFLAEHGEAIRAALREREKLDPALVVAALWMAMAGPRDRLALVPPFERPMRLCHRERVIEARLLEQAGDRLRITVDGITEEICVLPGGTRLAQDGLDHTLHIASVDTDEWHLQIDGTDRFVADESWRPPSNGNAAHRPIELRAPFNGRIVALHAAANQAVSAGATLLVIESMKLEHAIAAPRSGTLASVAVELGQQVATQQLLMSFEATA